MYRARGPNPGANCRTINPPKGPPMKTHLKNAVMTTAIVLASIYVLRQIAVTRSLVDRAIAG